MCEFYLRVDSSNDPEVRAVGQLSVDSFAGAAQFMNPAPQRVSFPYEDTTLPGWWIPADLGTAHPTGGDPEGARPTLLFHGGFDSTEEELYFSGGAAAARRGYHVLAFAGPGQGSALRDQKVLFRPDWEAVVTPAVDWLLARPDVDSDRIALMGMSFGGLLAPRAAAAERAAGRLRSKRCRLSRTEALRLYTAGSAWFSGEEELKGKIVPGQYADFANPVG
jgi:pimeloyl-ACP methyl ester carboxylesterase